MGDSPEQHNRAGEAELIRCRRKELTSSAFHRTPKLKPRECNSIGTLSPPWNAGSYTLFLIIGMMRNLSSRAIAIRKLTINVVIPIVLFANANDKYFVTQPLSVSVPAFR